MCIRDRVWVANALAPEALRVAEGGEVTGRVATSQICFACMLGGDEGTTLFTMTAPSSDHTIVGAGDLLARIEAAEVGSPRAGRP